jgi:hypothetical protein
MVKVIDYKLRNSLNGNPFYALVLQGGIEMVTSASGNSYLSAKTVSIPTTFTEQVCASLVGSELPGSIVREEVEPYEYTVPETGELLLLTHRYIYLDQEEPVQPASAETGRQMA